MDKQAIANNPYLRAIVEQFIWTAERTDRECIWTFGRMNKMTVFEYKTDNKEQ